MSAPIQHSPKTVSVFGDSYSFGHIDKAAGMAYSPLASIGGGGGGAFIVLDRSYGGLAAVNAATNTGAWDTELQMGGTFAFVAPYDVAGYQLLRYGINEALREVFDLSQFKGYLTTLVHGSKAAGRKPILVTTPRLPVQGLVTSTTLLRFDYVNARIREVAGEQGVPLIELSGWSFTSAQMFDTYHPNAAQMHALNVDLGGKLKTLLQTY